MTGMSAPENDAQAQFASLMGQLDQPMYVVTVRGADGPAGCLVGFASQVSIDPPLFLAGLSEKNHTWRASRQASHLAVHIIPRAEDELVHLFGELTGDSIDKFAQCAWRDGPHGVPILERSAAWFVGEILARITLGDHIGHVLLPVAVSRSRELGRYVSFSDVRGLTPGHEA